MASQQLLSRRLVAGSCPLQELIGIGVVRVRHHQNVYCPMIYPVNNQRPVSKNFVRNAGHVTYHVAIKVLINLKSIQIFWPSAIELWPQNAAQGWGAARWNRQRRCAFCNLADWRFSDRIPERRFFCRDSVPV